MRVMVCAVMLAAVAAPVGAQVSPERLVAIAKAVHDAEGYHLGSASTREYRNAYWARVVGIVHFGHPAYNQTPDPSWCLKDAGAGRPQSDDVAVKCATREFWDFIGDVGANGYTFRVGAHPGERLPADQNVYPPPRPSMPSPPPTPTPTPAPEPVNLQPVLDAVAELRGAVDALDKRLNAILALVLSHESNWTKAAHEAGEAAARASDIKTAIEALPTPEPQKCVSGRQNGWAGGAIRLCPE